eukprot:scaffold324800_cov58-Tisochrysis_lutea.AAC.1
MDVASCAHSPLALLLPCPLAAIAKTVVSCLMVFLALVRHAYQVLDQVQHSSKNSTHQPTQTREQIRDPGAQHKTQS